MSGYRLLERLGTGSMAVVYRGEETQSGRSVALKFLFQEFLNDDDKRRRFRREAEAAASLRHPNVCVVHEIVEREDETFLVMEHVDGPTIQQRIETDSIGISEALDICIQAARGLAEAHRQGILHRDVKSANLMLASDGVVKVVDFGLARVLGRTRLTSPGTRMGTPFYMSPEQTLGEDVDRRSDIWSLGVVLYQIVVGELPFNERQEEALLYSVVNENFAPVKVVPNSASDGLNRTLTKALAKDPNQRYQHLEDLAVDLALLRKRLPKSH